MISVGAIFIGFVILLGSLPLIGAKIVSARGIFLAYVLSGALVPAIIFLVQKESLPTFLIYFSNWTIFYSIILVSVFTIMTLYISRFMEIGWKWPRKIAVYSRNSEISVNFAIISIISFLIFIVSMAYLSGGLGNYMQRMYQRVSLDSSFANSLAVLYFLGFVFSIFSLSFSRGSANSFRKFISWSSVLMGILIGSLSGGRSIIVLYIFAIVYPYLVRMKTGRLLIFSSVLLIIFGVVSFYMLNLRYEMQEAAILNSAEGTDFFALASTGIVFLDSVAAAIEYTNHYGIDFGQLYLNVLGQPIPRALWPDKPLQISILLREFLFGDTTGGIPPGLIGESFIAFGIVGPILIAPVFAWLLTSVNRISAIAEATDCRASAATAGVLLPLVGYALVRGGFDIALVRVGIPAFWCFCGYWMARRSRLSIDTPVTLFVVGGRRRPSSGRRRIYQMQQP